MARRPTTKEFTETGVVLEVRHELDRVSKLIKRWEAGDLSSIDMAHVLRRISRAIDRNDMCWCKEESCCPLHEKHITPHNGGGCLLR